MVVLPLPEDGISFLGQRDDPRHAALCDDADDAEVEIDLGLFQQEVAAAQPRDDRQPAQLGEIDILNLVERGFFRRSDLADRDYGDSALNGSSELGALSATTLTGSPNCPA
jgi:hypothetical protein